MKTIDYAFVRLIQFLVLLFFTFTVLVWYGVALLIPLTLFSEGAREVMQALPFWYTFYFPVSTLLGKVEPGEWIRGVGVSLAWCAALMLVVRTVWRRGLLQYAGVGI